MKLLDYQSDASRGGGGGDSALGNKLVQSRVSWFEAKIQLYIIYFIYYIIFYIFENIL